ncbi:hypothetical protein X943_002064 [Babesia divergens]|uniref:CPW-WPC domain-containing protein n=1 Tax=Babesia divergens TaxID=32595 RepID=A0AAD9LJF6_BABDI|nr:hypothetical protein X943_002064 [Babesia divergens]
MLVIWLCVAFVAISSAQRSVLFDRLLKEAELRYAAAGTVLTADELANRVTVSLKSASDLLDLETPVVHDNCELDFSAFCPEGWIPSGDGVHCEVLPGNTGTAGICGRQLHMGDKSPLEKLHLMRMCDLRWPCLKSGVEPPDNDNICPQYWVRDGGECLADATYMGPCENKLKLVGKSRSERNALTQKCKLVFPRYPDLLDDHSKWSANCPLGWLYQEDGVCMQLLDQSPGRCGRSLKFNSIDDKREKSKRCGLVWPPHTDEVEGRCPLGWRFDETTAFCMAPSSYTGPCQLRVDFTRYTVADKALWAHVCGTSFLDSGVSEPSKPSTDISYRNGALDQSLSVVRFGKPMTDVGVMEKQLDALYKLRKKSTDGHFLKTLGKSIATLKSHIKHASSEVSPSFLQLASMTLSPDKKMCPYGWRQFQSICVASDTYGRVVPSCKTIRQASEAVDEKCRIAERSDNPNEDFVRSHCPLGWKIRQVYFGNLIHHLCVAPLDFKESQKQECGGGTLDFSARSPGFKRRWAFACGQHFPDFSDSKAPKCIENFFWQCPSEWIVKGGECVAPRRYGGPCPGSVKLSEIASDTAKAEFSRRCYAAWPCIGHCDKQYEQVSSQVMVAFCCHVYLILWFGYPNLYWSHSHKEELEFLCDVHWPCRKV